MKSKKVKEIKKALETYGNANKGITILRDGEIHAIPYTDILTLINELESKNEMLLNKKWDKEDDLDDYHEENQQLKNRIATLERKLDAKESYYNAVKDRALEVFVQKIEAEIPDESTFGYLGYNGVMEVIDEKLKECLGK